MKVINLASLLLLSACATISTDGQSIESIVLKKSEQYRQCYHESDSYLGKKEHQAPDMSFQFTLSKEGKITQSKLLHSPFKDANLNACIVGEVKKIKFTPQKNDYTFNINIPLSKKI